MLAFANKYQHPLSRRSLVLNGGSMFLSRKPGKLNIVVLYNSFYNHFIIHDNMLPAAFVLARFNFRAEAYYAIILIEMPSRVLVFTPQSGVYYKFNLMGTYRCPSYTYTGFNDADDLAVCISLRSVPRSRKMLQGMPVQVNPSF